MLEDHLDIEFSDDEKSGQVKGKGFEGTYKMSETASCTELSLTFTKKPFIIPWGVIESKMNAETKNW